MNETANLAKWWVCPEKIVNPDRCVSTLTEHWTLVTCIFICNYPNNMAMEADYSSFCSTESSILLQCVCTQEQFALHPDSDSLVATQTIKHTHHGFPWHSQSVTQSSSSWPCSTTTAPRMPSTKIYACSRHSGNFPFNRGARIPCWDLQGGLW